MDEKKENPLKCAVCEMTGGEKREDESVVTITKTTVISQSPGETLAEREIALCDACAEVGKERVLYKCSKCRSAFVSGFLKNEPVFETTDAENKPVIFSFNDNLAKAAEKPAEEISEKIVIFFVNECPICASKHGCGGKCGGCQGKCGDHDHGDHKCDGECGGKCHGNRSHEKDES